MYWSLYLRGEQAWSFVREVGFVSARKKAMAQFVGDKNTNIDTVPFLIDNLRACTSKNGYFRCADGVTRFVGFGFFNRKAGSGISYNRLRSTPDLVDKVRVVNPDWADTLETILKGEFFWDSVASVETAEAAVTYDFTVPETHSFVANGIVNHNSGGKTRRAAKMVILNADHPDIEEFIECKADAEKKAHSLIEAGYSGAFNVPNGAYDSVYFQNANHSVRATDDFMRAVELDRDWSTVNVLDGKPAKTLRARDLMHKIAQATWFCGDPGMQFDTTANRWHTCPNTARINASNPCCITGDTKIAVADGRNAVAIRDLAGQVVPVYVWDHAAKRTVIAPMHHIEIKRQNAPVYRVTLDDGSSFRATDDHLIMLKDGSYRQVKDLNAGDSLNPFHSQVKQLQDSRSKRRYVYSGKGWKAQYRWIWQYANGAAPEGFHIHHRDFDSLNDRLVNLELMRETDHRALHTEQMLGDRNPARRLMNDAWRANISRAVSGESNPNFGRTHGEPTREAMRIAAAQRWADPAQHKAMSETAKARVQSLRDAGKRVGRTPGERYERCCPACRQNFVTAREEQIFCGNECRYSPLGRGMVGAKGGQSRRGYVPSPEHREKLRLSSQAASRPEDKRRAQEESLRSRCLKVSRLLMDAGIEPTLAGWDDLRGVARELGAAHVPQSASLARFFPSDAELREHTALYNHKVVSVEFDGNEDVYDGTVDDHHNFGIVTSETSGGGGPDAPDFSGCFIHNSEFFFLDDTACNLASLNLMRFRTPDREFNVEEFKHAVRITITAQEIMVGNAAYPTDKITVNSFDYRPLGLGYANLGALLMARGLAYDSDEGRAYAAAITAILSGEAYHQSAKMAGRVGAFAGYERNKQPMQRVMQMHRDHVEAIERDLVPEILIKRGAVFLGQGD
jgi:ribonucleotide reductase alpha subunit